MHARAETFEEPEVRLEGFGHFRFASCEKAAVSEGVVEIEACAVNFGEKVEAWNMGRMVFQGFLETIPGMVESFVIIVSQGLPE